MIMRAFVAAAVVLSASGTAQAAMVIMKWPAALLAAEQAALKTRQAALDAASKAQPLDAEKVRAARRAVDEIGVKYHFATVRPTSDVVTVPDFEAKALLSQGFTPLSPMPGLANLDVGAALEVAPYDELVAFLTARGIGRNLFKWAARSGGQYSIAITRQMAIAAFDKDPE